MSNFTHEKPDEEDYFNTLLKWLEKKGEQELLDLLDGAKCNIYTTTSFSHKRWNGFWTQIQFYVPIEKLDPPEELIQKLTKFCNELMPDESGLDVMNVEFKPLITSAEINESPNKDLDDATKTISKEIMKVILPEDIKDMGKEMSRTYLYLYCIENILRLFIDNISKKKLGEDYFAKLNMRNEIRKAIDIRKDDETKNKWITVRGNSDIFYMDFNDLGSIIQNNWEIFSTYFPNQSWILTKIEELTKCRNLVAHNSIVGSHEQKLIGVYFESILRQLRDTIEN